NDSFHFGKGITYQSDFQKKLGTCFTIYPDMKLKDSSIKQNFFVLDSIEYGDGIIFRERVLDKVLHLYRPEIYKLSDYSKIWNNRGNYLYGNELMIVK
ncbi:Imm43 family immunity protein, partial [Phocaeicola massiliensis]